MKCPRCGGRLRVEALGMLRYTVDPATGRLGKPRIDCEWMDDDPVATCNKCGHVYRPRLSEDGAAVLLGIEDEATKAGGAG